MVPQVQQTGEDGEEQDVDAEHETKHHLGGDRRRHLGRHSLQNCRMILVLVVTMQSSSSSSDDDDDDDNVPPFIPVSIPITSPVVSLLLLMLVAVVVSSISCKAS